MEHKISQLETDVHDIKKHQKHMEEDIQEIKTTLFSAFDKVDNKIEDRVKLVLFWKIIAGICIIGLTISGFVFTQLMLKVNREEIQDSITKGIKYGLIDYNEEFQKKVDAKIDKNNATIISRIGVVNASVIRLESTVDKLIDNK